jgi:hypothetical protein
MCNGGASKSKSVEVLRLFTVPSVGASASMAIRTWDNQRQTKNYDRSFVDRGAAPYRLFIYVHHRSGSSASDQKELVDVKIPGWLRWNFNRPKSDRQKVRQRTDQMIKHQQLQKELLGETQEKERREAQ